MKSRAVVEKMESRRRTGRRSIVKGRSYGVLLFCRESIIKNVSLADE